QPIGRPLRRARGQVNRANGTGFPIGGARPAPLLRALGELGPYRITFNITEYRQEVLVLLDGERLVAPLPDVATPVIALMITTHVCVLDPVHPPAQIAIV